MMIDTETRHVTPADGNIFLDLGFAPEEASMLLAQSNEIIDEKRRLKEQLMEEISLWIKESDLKQDEAAERLKVSRPRVSDVKRKKTEKFTLDALVEMLARAGKHVTMQVA